jgi:hypothetical protein
MLKVNQLPAGNDALPHYFELLKKIRVTDGRLKE